MTKINGPINIVKLIGKNKILYLFFDIHEDLDKQTMCLDNHSIDIHEFLHIHFSKITEDVDFFLEINNTLITSKIFKLDNTKNVYLENVQKWVSRNYITNNDKKVHKSQSYPKVRFHFVDIRNHFENTSLYENNEIDILSLIDEFKSSINNILDNFKTKELTPIKKLLDEYNSPENKKILNNYVNNTFIKKINNILILIDKKEIKMKKYLDIVDKPYNYLSRNGYGIDYKVMKKLTNKMNILADNLVLSWLDILVYLTDIYFIRRFIDKSYIKKAYFYGGAFHNIHIILILVKYFNFKVSNATYIKTNINYVNNEIKKNTTNNPYDLIKLFYPPILNQCVELPGWFD
jgi:hypothetical protein